MIFSLLVVFFLSGYLASLAAIPSPLGAEKRALLSLAISPAIVIVFMGASMLLGGPLLFYFLLLLLIPLATWRMWPLRRPSLLFLEDEKFWRNVCWVAGGFLLLLVCIVGPYHLLDISSHLHGAIAFYHWGIVRETFWAGHIPSSLLEWNRWEPFPYEYLGSVLHGAGASFLAGQAGFVFSEYYRLLMLFYIALGLYALWARFMARPFAWLASLVVLSTSRFASRIDIYKPELVAVSFAVWAAWLLDEAIERRSMIWGAFCGLVSGAAVIAHPVGSTLLFPLFAAVLLARVLQNWRLPWRPLLLGGAVAAGIFLAGLVFYGQTEQDLSQSKQDGVDQSIVLYDLAFSHEDYPPGLFGKEAVVATSSDEGVCSSPFGFWSTVQPFSTTPLSAVVLPIGGGSGWMIPLLLALALFASSFLFSGKTQRAIVFLSVYLLLLGMLVFAVCGYYDTWVPERVGPGRVAPYWAFALGGIIAGGAAALVSLVRGKLKLALGAFFAAAIILLCTPILRTDVVLRDPQPTGQASAALRWIKEKTPKGSVVLLNAHTEGGAGAITRRSGLLDGRTPFVQPDPWRSRAIELLHDSRWFFLTGDEQYLPEEADYLVVLRGHEQVGSSRFPVRAPLRKVPALQLQRQWSHVQIYKVLK